MARAGDGNERSSKRKREHILSKRVDAGELAAFKSSAREAGFGDHREYLSALILGTEGFERQDRTALIRALGELGKHGSNLNQIAHSINVGKISALSATDIETIKSARASVEDVAAQIKGLLT